MYFLVSDVTNAIVKGEESRVMFSHRLSKGERIEITDLRGKVATARVEEYDKPAQTFRLSIDNITELPPPTPHILFQAQLDKSYMDQWAEVVGLSSFTEVYVYSAQRSQPGSLDNDRLIKKIQQSALLSQHAYTPQLQTISKTSELQELLLRYLPTVLHTKTVGVSDTRHHVVVGPEGGFSDEEVGFFTSLGLPFASLGSAIYPGWIAGFVASVQK